MNNYDFIYEKFFYNTNYFITLFYLSSILISMASLIFNINIFKTCKEEV